MADCCKHVQRGEHPRVSSPEVAEVVVRGVFTPEYRVVLGHGGLDEGMTHPGDHDLATFGLYDLWHYPRGDLVTDDGAAWFAGQLMTGDHRRHYRRADDGAALVNDEATIGITIE